MGRGKRFLGGSHYQACWQGWTWKHIALNTHETQRPVFKMFPLSGWILYHKGKRKKPQPSTSSHTKIRNTHIKGRKLPFWPNSAAADTVSTHDLEDNTDAMECHCLQNLQRQWYVTGINKKEHPKAQDSLSKAVPASLDTTWKTQLEKTRATYFKNLKAQCNPKL